MTGRLRSRARLATLALAATGALAGTAAGVTTVGTAAAGAAGAGGLSAAARLSAPRTQVTYARDTSVCPHPTAPHTMQCYAMIRTIVAQGTAGAYQLSSSAVGRGPAGGYTPGDLAAAYGFNPDISAHSQTIAIVDWYDDPDALADLNRFDAHYGLPRETSTSFRKVNQSGQAAPLPRADHDNSVEIALDVEAARGTCHTCHLLLVEATSPSDGNLAAAENRAAALGATEISNSYGEPESIPVSAAAVAAYNHPGIVITASTGDDGWFSWDGANDEDPGESAGAASFPATANTVVAVGGTELGISSTGARSGEVVWNGNGLDDSIGVADGSQGATGGGCSLHYTARPAQSHDPAYAAAGCHGKRLAADVAAVADPATGYDIVDDYAPGARAGVTDWMTIGGTSLSSPLTAAMFALAGGAGGAAYPATSLYVNAEHFPSTVHDIVPVAGYPSGNGFCGGDTPAGCGQVVEEEFGTHNPNALQAGETDCSFARDGADTVPAAASSECNAAAGLDGPTGLGTPNSLRLFRSEAPAVSFVRSTLVHRRAGTFAARATEKLAGIRVTGYAWNWGDGHLSSGTTARASHTYAKAGHYTVRLTVADSAYQTAIFRKVVVVG